MNNKNQFTITKKVVKHGKQAVITIPKVLGDVLLPGTIVELTLIVLKGGIKENE